MAEEENGTTNTSTSINPSSRLSNTRALGAFPSHVLNLSSPVNASSNESNPPPYSPNDSCCSLPPPYSANEPSCSNANLPSVKNLPPPPYPSDGSSIKISSPFPIDRSLGREFPTPYPTSSAPVSSNSKEPSGPSDSHIISGKSYKSLEVDNSATAPTLDEINYKTGLTALERQEIMEAFSRMESSIDSKTVFGKSVFLAAEKKILDLVRDAEPRLTDIEKEELVLRVKNIVKMRRNGVRKEIEIVRREEQNRMKKERKKERKMKRSNTALILIKLFQFILNIIILFAVGEAGSGSIFPESFFIPFVIVVIIITGTCLILYSCFDKLGKQCYRFVGILSFVLTFIYFTYAFTQIFNTSTKTCGFLAAAVFFMEFCLTVLVSPEEVFPTSNSSSSLSYSTGNYYQSQAPRTEFNYIYYCSPTHNRLQQTDHYAVNNYSNDGMTTGFDYDSIFQNLNQTSHLLDFLNVNVNDRDSDSEAEFQISNNDGGEIHHNSGGDCSDRNSVSDNHCSGNNGEVDVSCGNNDGGDCSSGHNDEGDYSSDHNGGGDCSSGHNDGGDCSSGHNDGGDYSGGYSGGGDSGGGDYGGGDSGGGDYGGGDSGGGDYGGGDSGGGDCGGSYD